MRLRISIIILVWVVNASAQNAFLPNRDSVLYHNAITGEEVIILPVPYDTSIHEAHSLENRGLLPGYTSKRELANFCDDTSVIRCKVDEQFSLENFPFRTIVRVWAYHNGNVIHGCTGILIGPNYVLTVAHALRLGPEFTAPGQEDPWPDSVVVKAAYDNHQWPELTNGKSQEYYIIKHYLNIDGNGSSYTNPYFGDMALLKLDDDIGKAIGWASFGFSEDTAVYFNRHFFNIGYPSGIDEYNQVNITYNGLEPYLQRIRFTEIDTFSFERWMMQKPNIIHGYSGSSSWSQEDSMYTSYAIGQTPSSSQRITGSRYFTFKSIMDADDSIPAHTYNYTDFNFNTFPNPSSGSFSLNCIAPVDMDVTVEIFGAMGQRVFAGPLSILKGYSTHTIDAGFLTQGIYLLRVSDGKDILRTTKVLVQPR